MLFDSHCHLDAPQFRDRLPGLLRDAEAAGVARFLVPGVNPEGWPGIALLSRSYPNLVFPAFGVHPMHAHLLTSDALEQLRRLTSRATAIGEIGLDYALPSPERQTQRRAFRVQLKVAIEAGLPVLIHCRKAFQDLLAILDQEGAGLAGGVMHAFSGSPEVARDCVRRGFYISLAGPVTYANALRPPAVAASVPLERLLLETDAPDLAPEPHRGGVNLPQYLADTAARVAAIRGMSVADLARATTANAERLFRLA